MAEITLLDPAPFRACGDFYQGVVERLLERAAMRQSESHIGWREDAFGRLDRSPEPRGDQVLKRPNAVDDCVHPARRKRGQRAGEIVERRVFQTPLVEILGPRGMGDRGEALAR